LPPELKVRANYFPSACGSDTFKKSHTARRIAEGHKENKLSEIVLGGQNPINWQNRHAYY